MLQLKERSKTWQSNTNIARLLWITTLATALLISVQAAAFDITRITEAPPELLKCLTQKIGSDKVTAILKGNPPEDKKSRRQLKKAYKQCALMTGATIPKDIAPYTGPLFDAMSQIDGTVDHDAAIERVRKIRCDPTRPFCTQQKTALLK